MGLIWCLKESLAEIIKSQINLSYNVLLSYCNDDLGFYPWTFVWEILNYTKIMWESIVEVIIAENMWDSWEWTNWTYLIFISLSWLVGLHVTPIWSPSWNKDVIVNFFFCCVAPGQGLEAAEIFGCNKQGFRLRESNVVEALKYWSKTQYFTEPQISFRQGLGTLYDPDQIS